MSFTSVASASVTEDLHRQVELELAGDPASCLRMTPFYQGMFTEAAQSFGAETSCGVGVEVMAEIRESSSGKSFPQQRKRQLKAILRGSVSIKETHATVTTKFAGTPPGWKQDTKKQTREVYRLEMLENKWDTDWMSAKVKPRR